MIGLTGPNAAGKGEIAHYLESLGYAYHSLSDAVRDECRARGLDTSRDNMVRVGNEMRAAGGPGALVERLAPRLRPPAIVDSVRNPGEVEALRRLPGFFLLGVDAASELRFERIRSRSRLGDVRTLEEFRSNEARENSSDGRRQQLSATLELADAVVRNDTTLEALHQSVAAALDGRRDPTENALGSDSRIG